MLEMEVLTLEQQQQQQQQERDQNPPQGMNIILPEEEDITNICQSTKELDSNLYRETQALIEVDKRSGEELTNMDIARALQQEEANLIKKIINQDTDSLDVINRKRKVVHNIECKGDTSVASSLTNF